MKQYKTLLTIRYEDGTAVHLCEHKQLPEWAIVKESPGAYDIQTYTNMVEAVKVFKGYEVK